jgi:hypothetical protein
MGLAPYSDAAAPPVPAPPKPWESEWPAITKISVVGSTGRAPIQSLL